MKSKIWGLGLSRTGTSTLTYVLNEVGYNHIHYPTDDEMLSFNNDGASDIPVIPKFKKLDTMFPNSKFILTTRDKEKWLQSMSTYLARKVNWNQSTRTLNIRESVYGDVWFNYSAYERSFDNHEKNIREYFKKRPNDLLVLNIVDGIDKPQKLFDFLGINKTMEEFPHRNYLKR
tara:strand:- start:4980 stop:5501 length:522 start_codon:yes stop_codon:yes gene_type:complete